jgi:O-antigen/teichoic acid export membrane protein
MGLVIYAVLFASAPAIGRFFHSPDAGALIPIAALTFLITPLGAVAGALIQRRLQFHYQTLADWTDTLVGAVVTVALAFSGYGIWSIPYGHLTAVSARVLLQVYFARWRPSLRFSRAALGELLSFGLGVQMKRLLEYTAFHIDGVVVGRLLGTTALGFYDKAFSTMNRFVTRLTLGQAAFRIFSIIHEDRERFQRAYSRLILSVTLIGYPVLTACIVLAEPLFVVLYGERWLSAVRPFQLLCVGGMLKLLNAYGSQANEAAGGIWSQVRRQAVGALLIVVGAAVGSAYAGINGAALGVAAAMIVLTISMQALVRRMTGLSWAAMLSPQLPAIVCAAALAVVVLACDVTVRSTMSSPPALVRLAVDAVIGGMFYGAFVIFSPFAAVREIVKETLDDFAPGPAVQAFNRLSRLGRASSAP